MNAGTKNDMNEYNRARTSTLKKVSAIFRKFAGRRAERLNPDTFNRAAAQAIAAALVKERGFAKRRAYDIGFHLSDWAADAAFIVALHLFPERFTEREIETAVEAFLIHAPSHVTAAATLLGHPIDIFDVGVAPEAPTKTTRRKKNPHNKKRGARNRRG